MSADGMTGWRTGIARVVSAGDEEEVLVRGRKLSELVGALSFSEMMFLLLSGREPTAAQAKVLDALLVASMEHGIAPPSMVARLFASYGTSIQAAVGGGIISFGDVMGGAGEQLAKLMAEAVGGVPGKVTEDTLKALAKGIAMRAGRIPGYGIPLHGADPRAPKVLEIARAEGVHGDYCRLAELIEDVIAERTGKRIPMNLDGVSAAVVLDFGFPWQSVRLFLLTPRSVSMGAHYLEEQAQGTKWRHLPAEDISYES